MTNPTPKETFRDRIRAAIKYAVDDEVRTARLNPDSYIERLAAQATDGIRANAKKALLETLGITNYHDHLTFLRGGHVHTLVLGKLAPRMADDIVSIFDQVVLSKRDLKDLRDAAQRAYYEAVYERVRDKARARANMMTDAELDAVFEEAAGDDSE